MSPSYTQSPTFETGQILGRGHVSVLRDNDDYFNALGNRWRCIPCGVSRSWIGDETYITIFDGYHFLESDALTLTYHLTLSGSTTAGHAHLYYNWDGNVGSPGGTSIATISADGTSSSTYDLTTFHGTNGDGLYRVGCVQHRSAYTEDQSLTTTCRPPYTTYTGAKSFSTPPTITDGSTGTATHFNTLRSNDLFFNDCVPRQPAFAGMEGFYIPADGGPSSASIWDGWVKHRGSRIYYSVGLALEDNGNSDNTRIQLYYDWDGTPEQIVSQNTEGTFTSYKDLTGTYTVGNWYRVHGRIIRATTGFYNAAGTIYYAYAAPPIDTGGGETAFSLMDEFTEYQWVYGNTAGQDTRLALLSSNDTSVYERLCWNSSSIGRYDFAVATPRFTRLGGTNTGDYYLIRRGDTLYYRGSDITMHWGTDSSESLEDETTTYAILDLNSLDLPYGTIYRLDGGVYAMER